jgi:ubiquinone/menaquinone biosynthesis C-methylase UbiE
MNNNRKLIITVDVEAQPARAEKNHVERLIWGKYPEGDFGISQMMDIADKHDIKLVMFLDYCEEHLYGEALLDVGREIHRRGHDLQLHAHPDFLSNDWLSANNLSGVKYLNEMDEYEAQAVFDFICDAQIRTTGIAPIAYRGGAYRFNKHTLNAANKNGVLLHSSFNYRRTASYSGNLQRSKQFLWSNGCFEIPISTTQYSNTLVEFNFCSSYFPTATSMIAYLEKFYNQMGNDAIATLVLHSWSFLELVDNRFFERPLPEAMSRFSTFVELLKESRIEVINSHQALELVSQNQVSLEGAVAISDLIEDNKQIENKDTPILVTTPRNYEKSQNKKRIKCPICGSLPCFESDKINRACPVCKSAERQRIFWDVYSNRFKTEQLFTGKQGLLVSPSLSERKIFKKILPAELITVDIRPEIRTDICADISKNLPFEDNYFDFIYASYVLTCTKELEAALKEFKRILKPDGLLITIDPLSGEKTREFKEIKQITSHYGRNAYDKFGIGSFRIFGKKDLNLVLSKFFEVNEVTGKDNFTNIEMTIFMSKKPNDINKINEIAEKSNDTSLSDEEIIAKAEKLWAKDEHSSVLEAVSLLQQLFDKGKVKGTAYRLGTAYYLGKGVRRNLETAYQYFLLDDSRYSFYYRGLILSDKSFSGFNLQLALKDLSDALKMGASNAQAHIDKIFALLNSNPRKNNCTLCGKIMETLGEHNKCPHCMGPPRTRMLPVVLNTLKDEIPLELVKSKPLLGFAVNDAEEKALSKVFPMLTSASLYGNYRKNHIEGCDVRDLSRFPDNSFSGVFSILLFDYFVEIDQALAECMRVTAPGGVFITHIAHYRLVDGNEPVTVTHIIQPKAGYFEYVPDNANMPSTKLGPRTFIQAMRKAGYQSAHYRMDDLASGEQTDWFIGFVPDKN